MKPSNENDMETRRRRKATYKNKGDHLTAALTRGKQRVVLKCFLPPRPSQPHLRAWEAREGAEAEADTGVPCVVVVDMANTPAIDKVDIAHEQLVVGNMSSMGLVREAELVGALLALAMDHCCGVVERIAVGGGVVVEVEGAQDKWCTGPQLGPETQCLEGADTGWLAVVEGELPCTRALREVVVDNLAWDNIDMPDKALEEEVQPRTSSGPGKQAQWQSVVKVLVRAAVWQSSHSLLASLNQPWGCRCYLAGMIWYSSSDA
jgi:hypothetical protein